jgi:hypothetical protein
MVCIKGDMDYDKIYQPVLMSLVVRQQLSEIPAAT